MCVTIFQGLTDVDTWQSSTTSWQYSCLIST